MFFGKYIMPNIKSAKKRATQSIARCKRNVVRKSAIKSSIKKMLEAIDSKNVDLAKELLREVEGKLARAKSKRVFHANTAARKVSRLAKKVAQMAVK